jgi:hypothetical protein
MATYRTPLWATKTSTRHGPVTSVIAWVIAPCERELPGIRRWTAANTRDDVTQLPLRAAKYHLRVRPTSHRLSDFRACGSGVRWDALNGTA